MAKFKWRKWNNILHRDIGYLAVGLTIVFAISGIAVNHVSDWNPSYSIEYQAIQVEPIEAASKAEALDKVLSALNISAAPTSSFRPSPTELHIFFDKQTIEINLQTGKGQWEYVEERALLHDMNFLHLNHAKKWWTWFSDIYAAALLFLAVSGLFVLKGKKGLAGRGKWFAGFGFLLPVFFLIIYKYL